MTRPTPLDSTASIDHTADTVIIRHARPLVARAVLLRHWCIAAGCAAVVIVAVAALVSVHAGDDGTGSTTVPETQVMYTIRQQGESP